MLLLELLIQTLDLIVANGSKCLQNKEGAEKIRKQSFGTVMKSPTAVDAF